MFVFNFTNLFLKMLARMICFWFFFWDRRRLTSSVICCKQKRYNDISEIKIVREKERYREEREAIKYKAHNLRLIINHQVHNLPMCECVFYFFYIFCSVLIYVCIFSMWNNSISTSRSFQRKLLKSQWWHKALIFASKKMWSCRIFGARVSACE